MATLNPYLNFNGNTEEAFNFYKSVFGGEFAMLQRFKDVPQAGDTPEGEKEKIMHIALPVGKVNMLMGTDTPESMGQLTFGNNLSLSLSTESEEETNKIFNALAAGGNITMPLDKMFWGAYFGMLTDKFGIHWMVNYDYDQQK
ncbi:MAG: VOC family protein [Ginsengibacter sp.]